jgi:hypothetical protein
MMARGALRWLLLGVIVVLGVVTLLFVRGPSFWQRQYYPLSYEAQIADSAARHRVNPYLVAAVINAESGVGSRGDGTHAGHASDGARPCRG